MSLQHFYLESQVIADENAETFLLHLSDDDVRHMKVLRLQTGEHIAVVDADSDYFECEIVSFESGAPVVSIARHLNAREQHPKVVLLQGLAKGDKMDEIIRHATELGVSGFVPLKCARSVMKVDDKRKAKKLERWSAIAKSAAMQSGQPAIPDVCEPQSIKQVAAMLSDFAAVCVCWEEALGAQKMGAAIGRALEHFDGERENARIAVVVGPEGGLTQEEVDVLLSCNPMSSLVSLGASILRTETAGIVAPALALYELGCLGE